MSPEEQTAVTELISKKVTLRQNAFSMFRSILRSTPEERKHMGCNGKTVAETLEVFVKAYIKDEDKLEAAHYKRFPD